MPREVGRSSAARARPTTAAASRASRGKVIKGAELVGTGVARIWSEASVTVHVGDNQFIKFTHGFEKLARDDKRSMVTAEREIFDACEAVVDRRVKRLKRLLRELEA